MTDGDEHAGNGKFRGLARLDVLDLYPGKRLVAEVLRDNRVPQELDLRVVERSVLHDLRCPQLIAAVDDRDLLRKAAEKVRFLECGIAAADHGNVVITEEEAVAGGTGRQTMTDEFGLPIEAQHDRLRTGGDDEGMGPIGRVGRIGIADPHAVGRSGKVDPADLDGLDLRPEALGLHAEVHHELGTHDPLGEPWEVLDVGGEHQLPAGLIAGRAGLTLEHKRGKVRASGVDRRGEAGGAGADDDDVAYVGHGLPFESVRSGALRAAGGP